MLLNWDAHHKKDKIIYIIINVEFRYLWTNKYWTLLYLLVGPVFPNSNSCPEKKDLLWPVIRNKYNYSMLYNNDKLKCCRHHILTCTYIQIACIWVDYWMWWEKCGNRNLQYGEPSSFKNTTDINHTVLLQDIIIFKAVFWVLLSTMYTLTIQWKLVIWTKHKEHICNFRKPWIDIPVYLFRKHNEHGAAWQLNRLTIS